MLKGSVDVVERQDIRFAILGSFECWIGERMVPLRGPLQERLAACLLLNRDRVVPVSRLIDTVWEDGGPNTAPHQIRKMTSDLRKRVPGLAERLTTLGAGYRMSIPDERIDTGLFAGALLDAHRSLDARDLKAAATHLRQALGQWRGPMLDGAGGPVIQALGAALEERRQNAVEQLFDIRLSLGESGGLIGDLREAIASNPGRETLRGQLMRALYASGRQAEALSEFQVIRKFLDAEYGIEPCDELVELHQRILRNDPCLNETGSVSQGPAGLPPASSAVETHPTTLPYALPDFIGRAKGLDTIFRAGAEPARSAARGLRIILIDGMAGSGKTTLAIHAAHRLQDAYPDGQLYIDLNGFTPNREPLETHRALGILLAALGQPRSGVADNLEDRIDQWRAATSNLTMLLVLDDVRGATQIRTLLPSSPKCLVLVTSRFRITGIDGASVVPLDMMSTTESIALLERVLGRDRVAAEQDAALRLVDQCGHLPLALRISAARLLKNSHWSISRLVERLSGETRRLPELKDEDRSVLACIKCSLDALEAEQTTALQLFCLHPGEEIETYAACALTGLGLYETEAIVESLLDLHLIEQKSADRYSVHSLVRACVIEALGDVRDERQEAALDRLTAHYRQTIIRAVDLAFPAHNRICTGLPDYLGATPELRGRDAALAWLDAERHNFLPALISAAGRGRHGEVAEAARDLVYYFHLRGQNDALFETATLARNSSESCGSPKLLRASLVNLAVACWRLGGIDKGLHYLYRALSEAQKERDVEDEAVCLSRIGSFYATIGEGARAEEYLWRAIAAHQASGNREEEAEARSTLSAILNDLESYEKAAEQAETAISINRELSSPRNLTMALMNLGVAQTGLGVHQEAISNLAEALEWNGRLGGSASQALILARLVPAFHHAGRRGSAADFAHRATEVVDAPDTPPAHRAVALNLLGEHGLRIGRPAEARARFTRALELSENLALLHERTRAAAGLADVRKAVGEHEEP
ncbi:BTAD domain-containing putative transcriptional regulator [Streptomyces sp. NPDC059349]|uniref:AfsR/SARP family transcriptional regulator n=1 Tax=Streptomyces sp. NPDC059349 TaxID=3346808 RepID=UPI0036CCF40B